MKWLLCVWCVLLLQIELKSAKFSKKLLLRFFIYICYSCNSSCSLFNVFFFVARHMYVHSWGLKYRKYNMIENRVSSWHWDAHGLRLKIKRYIGGSNIDVFSRSHGISVLHVIYRTSRCDVLWYLCTEVYYHIVTVNRHSY